MEATSIAERISSLLHTRHWYHALTLEERLTPLFHRESMNGIPISEQARKKLRRWKEQAPFEKGSFFADRLAMDHITEEEMLALLDEPVEALQQRVAHSCKKPSSLLSFCLPGFPETISLTSWMVLPAVS